MLIGVDFDNTIVRYDALFHRLAVEKGLVPEDAPATKDEVRNRLRAADDEDSWTRLQGEVYGARMAEAEDFPGARHFLRRCRELGVPTAIISHKTLKPYLGPPYDLHAAAREWLAGAGFAGDDAPVPEERVHFETTKEAKLARIGQAGCSHFIDDLPEFLAEHAFPDGVVKVLFDPHGRAAAEAPPGAEVVRSWGEASELLLDPVASG